MGTIIAYIVILALLVRALLRSGKKGTGKKGEEKVASRLKTLRKHGRFEILNDILIPNGFGGTSQIDHVVVCGAGVFVIETKNYKGKILGDPSEAEWTQKTHGQEFTFENPLFQNRGHIAALKGLLQDSLPGLKYHSIVVFPSRNLLKVSDPRVVSRKELSGTILGHLRNSVCEEDADAAADIIRKANLTSRKDRKAHAKQAKRRQKQWKRRHS